MTLLRAIPYAGVEAAANSLDVTDPVCMKGLTSWKGVIMAEQGVAGDQLRAFIERIERLEEEKKAISDDIRDVYAEAKGNGFDAKILRQVVRIRKLDKAERMEQEAILDLYMHALGMVPDNSGLGDS